MRPLLALLLSFALLAPSTRAQTGGGPPPPPEPPKPRAPQLPPRLRTSARDWLRAAPWLRDFAAARRAAVEGPRLILVYLAGPLSAVGASGDPPCLAQAEFAAFAKDLVLLCPPEDSPKDGPSDDPLWALAAGSLGPAVVLLKHDGALVARHIGRIDLAGLAKTRSRASTYLEWERKAAAGDGHASLELVVLRLDLQTITPGEAEAQLRAVDLKPDDRKRADAILLDAQVEAALKQLGPSPDGPLLEQQAKRFLTWAREGRRPRPARLALGFWNAILRQAEAERDVEAFAYALDEMKKQFGAAPETKPYFEEQERILARLSGRGSGGGR